MLPRVLLHVIEAACPIDLAVHGIASFEFYVLSSQFRHVSDRSVLLVDDLDDSERAEAAGVERLAAGGWIEGGAIQRHQQAIVAAIEARDRRVKRPEIRVGVIEAVGHRVSTIG